MPLSGRYLVAIVDPDAAEEAVLPSRSGDRRSTGPAEELARKY
jgi:hypothetical protein